MQIMNIEDQPRRNDMTTAGVMKPAGSGVLRTIDADAIHGVVDLYSIAVPEPSSVLLMTIGYLLMFGRHRRFDR
jgi:PEP-CTERM motif